MIYKNVTELIGHTPIVKLNKVAGNLKAQLYAKIEMFNPAGSAKDRIALAIIHDYEKEGKLKPGSTVIEPTSGNTGIGLAEVCAYKGYKTIMVMPETMSVERRQLMQAYGAKIVLTEGSKGMNGAIAKAEELHSQIADSVIAGQFTNPSNWKCHYNTTALEIEKDLPDMDIFVAGIGTGGTVTGVAKYFKDKGKSVEIVGVEPSASPVLSGGKAGPHKIQGIGAGFVPDNLDAHLLDKIICVDNEDAFKTTAKIAREEGLLVGISAGACVWAAMQIASLEENKDKKILAFLNDSGSRYLTSGVFD